ncbi:hypothetical protein RclHR1_14250001 [Rhizophagus clarus]|uniref:Ion transport domain-containing protein n=1 Tax=Rhizophagus clarus TaxID=94130 RepID=A0A2Z6R4U1_9GLOM|nr:hypothetical protein RclHR1_14250001 [Rhizophagus clarus]
MEDEKETVIEIDQTTQQHIEETKDDNPIQPHNRKKIDKFVSYDMSEDEIFAAAYINKNYYPIKFITLKNDSERLILIKDNCNNNNNTDGKNLQKIIDSFNTKSYIDTIGNPDDIILTESNKKLYIDKKYHHICRTDWLKKDEFEQLLNKTTTIYYGDIYTSTIFETIRKMLSRIISIDKFPENYVIEPDKLFRFNLEKVETWNEIEIKVKGFTKDNNDWKETQNNCVSSTGILVLYEQVDDQVLILITTFSELFKDSLPPPNFEFFKSYSEYHHLVEGIMNDPKDSLEFATKLLEIEIEREKENGAKYIKFMGQIRTKIFDMIIKSIEMTNSQQLPAIRQYMNIINSKLPQLCDNRYSSLPTKDFSLDQPTINDDKNNPWNLAIRYSSINSDGSISSNPTLIQTPDSNSNMFSWFPTSLLAMYLFLTGDSGSFSLWTYREDPMMTFLIFLFSFFTVVYLMNLFIGLLNMSIEDYNKYEEFLLSKARVFKILKDIELYHKLPFQSYYDIPVDKVRDLINAIDNKRTVFTFLPFISERLRKLIDVPAPIKQVEVELKELK